MHQFRGIMGETRTKKKIAQHRNEPPGRRRLVQGPLDRLISEQSPSLRPVSLLCNNRQSTHQNFTAGCSSGGVTQVHFTGRNQFFLGLNLYQWLAIMGIGKPVPPQIAS